MARLGLQSKIFSYVEKSVVKNEIKHNNYREALYNKVSMVHKFKTARSERQSWLL